jgi:hypothetical protein
MLLLVSSAFAAETDNAPGALCVATAGAVLNQLPGGEIENAGSAVVTVVCPADRKIVNGVFTTHFSGVVFGRDNNSNTAAAGNLCCRTVSSSPSTSASPLMGTEVCTTGVTPAANFAQLTLPEVVDNATASHFFIQCKIPAKNTSDSKRSQLYSFRSIQQ